MEFAKIFELVEDKVYHTIIKERKRYDPIYKAIDDYVVKNGLILGGNIALDIYTTRDRNLDGFVYEIYARDGLEHAKAITDLLAKTAEDEKLVPIPYTPCQEVIDKYFNIAPAQKKKLKFPRAIVVMRTTKPFKKYEITFDYRTMVKVYSTPFEMQPTETKFFGDFSRNCKLVPSTFLWMDVLKKLCSPTYADKWERLLKYEHRLYDSIKVNERHLHDAPSDPFKTNILEKLALNNKEIIVAGDPVLYLMKQIQSVSETILITGNFEETKEKLKREWTFSIEEMDSPCFGDYQMRAIRIKEINTTIYNLAEYDLIPFNPVVDHSSKSGGVLQIATPFLMLRLLVLRGNIAKALKLRDHLKTKITGKYVTNIDDKFFKPSAGVMRLVPDNFLGVYVDERVAAKRAMLDGEKKFKDYIPDL